MATRANNTTIPPDLPLLHELSGAFDQAFQYLTFSSAVGYLSDLAIAQREMQDNIRSARLMSRDRMIGLLDELRETNPTRYRQEQIIRELGDMAQEHALHGEYIPENITSMLLRLAGQGLASAQYEAGWALLADLDNQPLSACEEAGDTTRKAMEWIQRAADQGHERAQITMERLENSHGQPIDGIVRPRGNRPWGGRLAEQAMNVHLKCHDDLCGYPYGYNLSSVNQSPNSRDLPALFAHAIAMDAATDSDTSQFLLALLILDRQKRHAGRAAEAEDFIAKSAARMWLGKAARMGHANACDKLAMAYAHADSVTFGIKGIPQSMPHALAWQGMAALCRHAPDRGNPYELMSQLEYDMSKVDVAEARKLFLEFHAGRWEHDLVAQEFAPDADDEE